MKRIFLFLVLSFFHHLGGHDCNSGEDWNRGAPSNLTAEMHAQGNQRNNPEYTIGDNNFGVASVFIIPIVVARSSISWFFGSNKQHNQPHNHVNPKPNKCDTVLSTQELVYDYKPIPQPAQIPLQPQAPRGPPEQPQSSNSVHQRTLAQHNVHQHWSDMEPLVRNSHDRLAAYHETTKDNLRAYDQSYNLSSNARHILEDNAIAPQPFTTCYGNALQHHLHQEVLAGVELSTHTRNDALHYDTLNFFVSAREANEWGDIRSTITLLDLGKSLLRLVINRLSYDDAVLVTRCGIAGMRGFVVQGSATIAHLVQHPENILLTPLCNLYEFTKTALQYVPPVPPELILLGDSQGYHDSLDHAAQKWRALGRSLRETWTHLPDMPAEAVCESVGGFTADCLIFDGCLKTLSTAARLASAEVQIMRNLNYLSTIHIERYAPGYFLMRGTHETTHLLKASQQYAVVEHLFDAGLKVLEKNKAGSISELAQVIEKFDHLPHVTKNVVTLIEQAVAENHLTHTASLCDHYSYALTIANTEEIIGIGCPLSNNFPVTFNIVTPTKAIHHVNLPIPALSDLKPNPSSRNNPILTLQNRLLKQRDAAQQSGKLFEVHFANFIEWEWANWLTEQQLAYDFVHKIKVEQYLKTLIDPTEWKELYAYAGKKTFLDPVSNVHIYPKIDLEHIFLPEFKWSKNGQCEIIGFHHDFLGHLESQSVITVNCIKSCKTSKNISLSKIEYNSGKKTATCFAKNLTREQVVEQIFEAINDTQRTITPERAGKGFFIRGKSSNNTIIDVLVNNDYSQIITAYPWIGQIK